MAAQVVLMLDGQALSKPLVGSASSGSSANKPPRPSHVQGLATAFSWFSGLRDTSLAVDESFLAAGPTIDVNTTLVTNWSGVGQKCTQRPAKCLRECWSRPFHPLTKYEPRLLPFVHLDVYYERVQPNDICARPNLG
jgi:hypothetical protein